MPLHVEALLAASALHSIHTRVFIQRYPRRFASRYSISLPFLRSPTARIVLSDEGLQTRKINEMADHFRAGSAVITGAASGIGRSTALSFARDGCVKLHLGDLNTNGLEETRKLIKVDYPNAVIHVARVDISDEQSVQDFYDGAITNFGRIDFAANVAGYAHAATEVTAIDETMYELSYQVNQRGTFFCQRAELRQMLKQDILDGYQCRGSIVNVTSLAAKGVIPLLSIYSATKAAILAQSKTDALDYGPDLIRVNCVAPGNTETPMVTKAMGPEHLKANAALNPLRRNAQPEDIANAIVWLSSPYAGYVTGIQLPVDGGQNLFTGHPHG